MATGTDKQTEEVVSTEHCETVCRFSLELISATGTAPVSERLPSSQLFRRGLGLRIRLDPLVDGGHCTRAEADLVEAQPQHSESNILLERRRKRCRAVVAHPVVLEAQHLEVCVDLERGGERRCTGIACRRRKLP